jgi:signal transduction histidine kinase
MSDTGGALTHELLKQQSIFAQFGELALKSDDLQQILTEACRLAGEALGTDLAKVVQLQEDGQTMVVRAGVGWAPGVVGIATIRAVDDTSEGHCLRTGEPMISPDIAKETRFRYPQFLIDNHVRAVANVIIIGGHDRPAFGVLQVDSRVPREFTESDTLFLRSYANLLAAAVDRIRVTNEARDHEGRLRVMLQETIAQRTHELTQANERLRSEAEERGRVEEALRQSLKMEAVGQLTGGLAHDFNNLLSGISGSLQLMKMRVTQGRMSEVGRYMDVAMTSVDRAAALTHRLLAFSRRQTLDPKPTAVNALIEGMRDIFIRTVGPGIKIETILSSELWPTLCDPNQLENALLNLVINARDAMPDGGRIQIETSNCVIADSAPLLMDRLSSLAPNGEYVALLVTDTGTGMSPAVIERAFDPFFTTKAIGQGTGLGLSMIYGFVQQSGGHVLLRSSEGHGSTVAIYLPRYLGVEDGQDVVAAKVDIAQAKAGLVVLVVVDEPAVRLVMADTLADNGYIVLEADTGRSAMSHIHSQARIDLLLTDVGLPGGMNGRQLAEAARQHRQDLKVLFVTGYDEQAALGSGLMGAGMAIMTKPFDISAFSAKVQDLLQH